MFRIVFDPAAPLLGAGTSDVITGAIHFDFNDGAFPLPGPRWVDRVHPNMGIWIEECRRLIDGEIAEGFVQFSEGPFGVFFEPLSQTEVQYRCVYGGARQHPEFFTGPFAEVVEEFVRVSAVIDRACADNGFVVAPLAPRGADLKRRFEASDGMLRI